MMLWSTATIEEMARIGHHSARFIFEDGRWVSAFPFTNKDQDKHWALWLQFMLVSQSTLVTISCTPFSVESMAAVEKANEHIVAAIDDFSEALTALFHLHCWYDEPVCAAEGVLPPNDAPPPIPKVTVMVPGFTSDEELARLPRNAQFAMRLLGWMTEVQNGCPDEILRVRCAIIKAGEPEHRHYYDSADAPSATRPPAEHLN